MKERKTTAKKWTLILLLIFTLVALIGGTYARYSSTVTGSGNVSIAKWAVKVNNNVDISNNINASNATTFDLTFTANNANTVKDKIAPGGTAVAYVDVNLTGTEVSVDFTCALADSSATNLTSVFGENYADKVTLAVGTPELLDGATNMTLSGTTVTVASTGAMSGKVRVPINLRWLDVNTNNATDTNTGATKNELTVPVTLTVQQHI